MTPAEQRDKAIAALCNLVFLYLLLAGLGVIAAAVTWVLWVVWPK